MDPEVGEVLIGSKGVVKLVMFTPPIVVTLPMTLPVPGTIVTDGCTPDAEPAGVIVPSSVAEAEPCPLTLALAAADWLLGIVGVAEPADGVVAFHPEKFELI